MSIKIKGIDVSKYQGDIDWEKVKASGVKFAIIRAGYGKLSSQIDVKFEQNYKNAKAVGLNVGAYWYSYATTVEDAKLEADAFYSIIKDKTFDIPVFFDIEDKTQSSLSVNDIEKITETFCTSMENYRYWVGVYSYKSFLENKFTEDFLKRYSVWVAHIGVSQTTYKHQYGIWQYSHTGEIDGISGDVDCNYCYIDYPNQIKKAGLNGYSITTSTTPEQPTQNYTSYIVKKGDTLWDIAEKYLGSGTKYPQIKSLNSLSSDTIYVNQVLKIPNE